MFLMIIVVILFCFSVCFIVVRLFIGRKEIGNVVLIGVFILLLLVVFIVVEVCLWKVFLKVMMCFFLVVKLVIFRVFLLVFVLLLYKKSW